MRWLRTWISSFVKNTSNLWKFLYRNGNYLQDFWKKEPVNRIELFGINMYIYIFILSHCLVFNAGVIHKLYDNKSKKNSKTNEISEITKSK